MPRGAGRAQKNWACPYPNGGSLSPGRADTFRLVSRKTWLSVSATEWAASASIELDPLSRPAAALATAMARLAPSATSTVRLLSEAMRALLPSDPAFPPHPAGPVGVRDGLGREHWQQPG